MALDIVSHMTQTANLVTLLASPLGEEGHEVAKGCTRVRMIMILDVDVTAEGGIIKLIARRAIHHPLNQPAKGRPNPLNLLNPHAEGVSNGRSILRTFPSEPSEPSEPSAPQARPKKGAHHAHPSSCQSAP